MTELWISIFLSTLRVSTPLIFAAMGGIMSERAGVVNIALESFMIVGAFSASVAAHSFHSPWMGALAAIVTGMFFAAIYALSVIQFKADQIVAGTAMNLLAMGAVPLASKALFDSTGTTPALEMADRFQTAPMFAAFILVGLIHVWMKKTRSGLWHGFAGEHPDALSTAGVRVQVVRWWAVLASGALAGLGGLTLSIFLSSSYSRGMTAGRGFMAIAALIFGKWKPVPTLFACLFFGLTDALQIRLQGVTLFGTEPIPVQFIQVLPYAITIFVLAGFVGKSRAPAKLGVPWMILAAFGLMTASSCDPGTSKKPQEASLAPAVSDADLRAGNVALLSEMLRVVFLIENPSATDLSPRASALMQGASLEGIYNGLIHSREYREAEKGGTASPAVVAAFAEAFADLQLLSGKPWRISRHASEPEKSIERPDNGATKNSGAMKAVPEGSRSEWAEHDAVLEKVLLNRDRARLVAFYRTAFGRSSFFTLKRVLGEAVMRTLLSAGERLPEVYADLTLAWNPRAGNLEVAARSSQDRAFHADWAKKIPGDRVLWESLNRAHRILNQSQKG